MHKTTLIPQAHVANIKPGDPVWLGDNRNPRRYLRTVLRLTDTQIVTNQIHPHDHDHFRRYNGLPVSRLGYAITGIARPQEIVDYNMAFEEEQRQKAVEADARERCEKLREELQRLFPEECIVRNGEGRLWEIEITGLTEENVRHIARRLAP